MIKYYNSMIVGHRILCVMSIEFNRYLNKLTCFQYNIIIMTNNIKFKNYAISKI